MKAHCTTTTTTCMQAAGEGRKGRAGNARKPADARTLQSTNSSGVSLKPVILRRGRLTPRLCCRLRRSSRHMRPLQLRRASLCCRWAKEHSIANTSLVQLRAPEYSCMH